MAVQTEWLEKDYYEVLGVAADAGDKDIQRAYRRLARQYHPDHHPDDASAEDRFKEIAAAYDVVGDPARRKEYDEVRRLGPMAAGFGPGAGRSRGGNGNGNGTFVFTTDDLGGAGFDLGDLLGDLFGAGRFGDAPRPRRGRDVEAELRIGLEDAAAGVTTEVALPGQPPVRVRVPAGVADGQLVRVAGKGEPGPDGGTPGDLFVRVQVAPHRLFGRDGANLTLTLPVTYPEAALGASVKVPTLAGPPVTIRVPAGTSSGRILRLRGKGLPRSEGGAGDLLVTVQVAVPASMGDEERKAVEALAAVTSADPRAHLFA